VKLALADDSGIFRTALARSLEDIGGEILISVSSADELLSRLQVVTVDAAIIDVAMPPTRTNEGVVAARHIKVHHPSVAVLLLSAYAATPQAIELLRDFDEGVGYLRKDDVADVNELRASLTRVMDGELVVDKTIVRRLLRAPAQEQALSRLTSQEREVLRLMAEGFSNAGIASQLYLAHRTVEDHVGHVFTKLGITENLGKSSNKRVLAVLTWLRLTSRPLE
jgi:DNA-binding NarL/FixJ family response regulator